MEYSVTELVSCPYMRRNNLVKPIFKAIQERGKEAHFVLEQILKTQKLQVEVPIEYSFRVNDIEFTIKGVIDVVDPKEGVLYDIKSGNIDFYALRQLLLYRDLWFLDKCEIMDIGFIVYKTVNGTLHYRKQKLYFHIPPLLTMIKEVKKVLAEITRYKGPIRIQNEGCKYCILREKCRTLYRYKGLRFLVNKI